MPKFVHTIPLMGKNVNIKCTELGFTTYKKLTKTIYNDVIEDIDTYISQTLDEVLLNYSYQDLDVIDKFIVASSLRDLDVSGELVLQATCPETDKQYDIGLSIEEIVSRINGLPLKKEYIVDKGDVTVTFGLPSTFDTSTTADLYCSSIKSITIAGKEEPLLIPDYIDKSEIFDKLPVSFFNEFREFLGEQEKILSEEVIFIHRSPFVEESEVKEFRLSFFDLSILHLFKLFFQDDLKGLYEFEYDLLSICNLPYEVITSNTYAELQLLYSIEATRRKIQNEEARGGTPPSTPPSQAGQVSPQTVQSAT